MTEQQPQEPYGDPQYESYREGTPTESVPTISVPTGRIASASRICERTTVLGPAVSNLARLRFTN